MTPRRSPDRPVRFDGGSVEDVVEGATRPAAVDGRDEDADDTVEGAEGGSAGVDGRDDDGTGDARGDDAGDDDTRTDDDGISAAEGDDTGAEDEAEGTDDAGADDAESITAVDLNRRADVTGDDADALFGYPGLDGVVTGVVTVALLFGVGAPVATGAVSVAFAASAYLLTAGFYDDLLDREPPRPLADAVVDLLGFLGGVGGAATSVATVATVAGHLGAALVGGAFGLGTGFLREDLTVDEDPAPRGPRRTEFVAHASGLIARRPDAGSVTDAGSVHVAWSDVAAIERGPEAIHVRRRDGPDLAPAVADVTDPDAVVRTWRRLAGDDAAEASTPPRS